MATLFVRMNALTVPDPVVKSRTYYAVQEGGLQSAVLRASDMGADMSPTRTVLAIPAWKSPQFNGRFFVK